MPDWAKSLFWIGFYSLMFASLIFVPKYMEQVGRNEKGEREKREEDMSLNFHLRTVVRILDVQEKTILFLSNPGGTPITTGWMFLKEPQKSITTRVGCVILTAEPTDSVPFIWSAAIAVGLREGSIIPRRVIQLPGFPQPIVLNKILSCDRQWIDSRG